MDQSPFVLDTLTVAPIAVWLAMHAAHPDDGARVAAFGLRPNGSPDARGVLVHALIHANAQHLLTNCAAHLFVASALVVPPGLRRIGVNRLVLGSLLLAVGAVAGVVASAKDLDRRSQEFGEAFGFGVGILESLLNTVHATVANQRLFCGASAAIAAVLGFNTVNARSPAGALMGLATIAGDVQGLMPGTRPPIFSLPAPTIAHAAHVGGFAAGALVALACKALAERLDDRARPPGWRGNGVGGRVLGRE